MSWWGIFVTLAIWQTVSVWLLWRLFVRAARNYQHSNRSSQPTSLRPTSPELDPDSTLHHSTCSVCDDMSPVPLAVSRLESDPWRLTWTCDVCGGDSKVRVHPGLVEMLRGLDRPGGMPLSWREVQGFEGMTVDEFSDVAWGELS